MDLKQNKRRTNKRATSRKVSFQRLETRNLLAAAPLGATELDTGEFLLGRVGVTPIFFESDGTIDPQSQNWTAAEIDAMLAKVSDGVNWWAETLDALDTVHTLEFVIDDSFAVNPVQTPYELIDRPSEDFALAVDPLMNSLGYGQIGSLQSKVQAFNHDQREKLGTDWAFTIFVVDSSDDADGLFAPGGFFRGAFAFAGGLFLVVPSSRPTSTITHEMGHVFWARDEYPGAGSWTDQRGYYNAQNLNAADNPTAGFVQEISIMRGGVPLNDAFLQNVSPASTLAMIGWRDSDGNGVFDVADVPLSLQGVGYYDASTSLYHFSGNASAVALQNQNSEGPQSDITLNRVSEFQYRLDNGPWIVAATPDQQQTELQLTIQLDEPFDVIDLRVIDTRVGVTSETITGSMADPAISSGRVAGFVFLDENRNGQRDPGEPLLSNVTVTIRNLDGTPLFSGGVDAGDLPEGKIQSGSLSDVQLTNSGFALDRTLGVFESSIANGQTVFQAFSQQLGVWSERWSNDRKFVAKFDQSVGEVELTLWAGSEPSYGRIEAYDDMDRLIGRATSQRLAAGEANVLRIEDAAAQIASIRVFGHAGSSVVISELSFGFQDTIETESSGVWRFDHLADGAHEVVLVANDNNQQVSFAPLSILVQAVNQGSLARSVPVPPNNPWHNAALPKDVNGDGIISAADALVIINDLTQRGPRELQSSQANGELIAPSRSIDVNNDGAVTAADALIVINALTLQPESGGESEWITLNVGSENRSSTRQHAATDLVFAAIATANDVNQFAIRNSDEGVRPSTRVSCNCEFSHNLSKITVVNENRSSTMEATSSPANQQTKNKDKLFYVTQLSELSEFPELFTRTIV